MREQVLARFYASDMSDRSWIEVEAEYVRMHIGACNFCSGDHFTEFMLLGIGVDILNQQRIASLLARRGSKKLVARILSAKEASDWNNLGAARQVQFLAVRYVIFQTSSTNASHPGQVGSERSCIQGDVSGAQANMEGAYLPRATGRDEAHTSFSPIFHERKRETGKFTCFGQS